eukprot:gene29119-36203_t
MGKKGKGAKGGPEKPDTMSDDVWALFNNSTDLIQNLRGSCVFNTINCILTRSEAAMFLWQHAASSQAKKEEIVQLGAVPHAIAAFKAVEDHERAPCVGLLHSLATVEVAREQMVNVKPIPPHPPINLVPLLFEHLHTDSTATETGVMGVICNLSLSEYSRPSILKEILSKGPKRVIHVMSNSLNAEARRDAARCLKECCTLPILPEDTPEHIRAKEKEKEKETKTLFLQHGLVEASIRTVANGCTECVTGVKINGPLAIESIIGLLHKMLQLEESKTIFMEFEGVEGLSALLSGKLKCSFENTLQGKASAAGCLYSIAIPQGWANNRMPSSLKHFDQPIVGGVVLGNSTPAQPPPAEGETPAEPDKDEESAEDKGGAQNIVCKEASVKMEKM